MRCLKNKGADPAMLYLQELFVIKIKKHKIRYVIVDGYAVMKYSEPRFTKALDVLISTDQKNTKSVYLALKEFGAPLENLTSDDFVHEGYFYQMGRPLFVNVLKLLNH